MFVDTLTYDDVPSEFIFSTGESVMSLPYLKDQNKVHAKSCCPINQFI